MAIIDGAFNVELLEKGSSLIEQSHGHFSVLARCPTVYTEHGIL